jgi:hemerythrin
MDVEMNEQIGGLNNKIDLLLEKVNALEVASARREEKQDALKESLDEMKVAAKEHYKADETRFAAVEASHQATAKAVDNITTRFKTVAAILSVLATAPHIIKFLFTLGSK